MTFYYHISYCEKKDEFWGIVDSDITDKTSTPIFTINNTEEMLSHIKSKVMSHIDDADGIEAFLKEKGVIGVDDTVLLCEEPLH